jgi:hypothetical protein
VTEKREGGGGRSVRAGEGDIHTHTHTYHSRRAPALGALQRPAGGIIAENGGRSRPRREPSVPKPTVLAKCLRLID